MPSSGLLRRAQAGAGGGLRRGGRQSGALRHALVRPPASFDAADVPCFGWKSCLCSLKQRWHLRMSFSFVKALLEHSSCRAPAPSSSAPVTASISPNPNAPLSAGGLRDGLIINSPMSAPPLARLWWKRDLWAIAVCSFADIRRRARRSGSVRFAGGGGPGIPEAGGRDAVVAVGGSSLGWLGGVCADFLEEILTAPMEVRSLCVVTL